MIMARKSLPKKVKNIQPAIYLFTFLIVTTEEHIERIKKCDLLIVFRKEKAKSVKEERWECAHGENPVQ